MEEEGEAITHEEEAPTLQAVEQEVVTEEKTAAQPEEEKVVEETEPATIPDCPPVEISVLPPYEPLSLDAANNVIHIPGNYATIQDGIDAAADGDAVLVAPGTYYENINFRGKSITVTSEAGPDDTIINGGRVTSVVTFWSGEDTNSVLHGFKITNGLVRKEHFPFGGGISIRDSSPTISHCKIMKNGSEKIGGGINVEGNQALPVIENNLISGNIATERAGGIEVRNGASPTIRDNIIIDNLSTEGSGIRIVNSASPVIEGNTISKNMAGYDMQAENAEQYLSGVDFTKKLTYHPFLPGGILVSYHCSPVIRNNVIAENQGGGIGVMLGSAPTIENNVISQNTGWIVGGILVSLNSTPVVTNNTIECNEEPAIWIDKTSSILDEQRSPMSLEPYTIIQDTHKGFTLGQNQITGSIVLWPPSLPERERTSSDRVLLVPSDYHTIQRAIEAANDGDTIIVAPGIYQAVVDFLGKRITVRSQNPDDVETVESTIIEGKEGDNIVKFQSGETRETTLEGFTLRNGMTGIYIHRSSPTIARNIISSCTKSGIQGVEAYSPLITGNIIKNNTGYIGGGICLQTSASPIIIGNEITGNEADFLGGGIFTWFSSPTIIDNIISNNKADSGAGIHTEHYSQAIIRGNSIWRNIAESAGGGGIKLDEFSNAIVDGNIITENQAHHGGGLGMILDCHPQITNNVIANNKGGGIHVSQSFPQVTNNTIVDNIKDDGKSRGITIRQNSNVFITNTILGNSEIYVEDEYSELTITHSLVKDDGDASRRGNDNISIDPLFVGDGDYHLLPSSPCIDAGTDVDVGTDIEGNKRPQGQGFDIGAYEYVTQD
ncbi:right-handed parallel beta-helix repeat-containing protein [Chloroflexota bacterium]